MALSAASQSPWVFALHPPSTPDSTPLHLQPVGPCRTSSWSSWSKCNCGHGLWQQKGQHVSQRYRKQLDSATAACYPLELQQRRHCTCHVATCRTSKWSTWSSCDCEHNHGNGLPMGLRISQRYRKQLENTTTCSPVQRLRDVRTCKCAPVLLQSWTTTAAASHEIPAELVQSTAPPTAAAHAPVPVRPGRKTNLRNGDAKLRQGTEDNTEVPMVRAGGQRVDNQRAMDTTQTWLWRLLGVLSTVATALWIMLEAAARRQAVVHGEPQNMAFEDAEMRPVLALASAKKGPVYLTTQAGRAQCAALAADIRDSGQV